MSYPRRVLPNTTYLATRRCIQRRFLLRPDPRANQAFLYCLGLLAEPCGMELHAFCMMSNHFHLVLTDREGTLPEFMQRFNRLLALCIKQLRGWEGAVWEPNVPYSAVALETPEAVLDKVAYTVLNPVSAGLVPKVSKWPGPNSGVSHPGDTQPILRPSEFFGPRSPSSVNVRLTEPSSFGEWSVGTYAQTVGRLIRERQQEIGRTRRRFLGLHGVRGTRPEARPRSPTQLRDRNPRFAAVTREALQRAAEALRGFRQWYREAFERWRHGERGTEFPPGTWWVVRYAGATAARSG